MTRQAKGSGKKLNLSKLTDPPRAVYTQAQRPEASMNWAVLNQTRISGLWRTKVSATNAVSPPINIGQGCGNRATDAMKGTKDTEVRTFATGIVNENDSLTIPRITNAAMAFQNLDGNGAGISHSRSASTHSVAPDTALM